MTRELILDRDGWQVGCYTDTTLEITSPWGLMLTLAPDEARALVHRVIALNSEAEDEHHTYGLCCPICKGSPLRIDSDQRRTCALGHEWRLVQHGFAVVDRA